MLYLFYGKHRSISALGGGLDIASSELRVDGGYKWTLAFDWNSFFETLLSWFYHKPHLLDSDIFLDSVQSVERPDRHDSLCDLNPCRGFGNSAHVEQYVLDGP